MSAPAIWDLEVSHSRGILILRRPRPDWDPTAVETRTYDLSVVIEALSKSDIHREAKEARAARAEAWPS